MTYWSLVSVWNAIAFQPVEFLTWVLLWVPSASQNKINQQQGARHEIFKHSGVLQSLANINIVLVNGRREGPEGHLATAKGKQGKKE